MVFDVVETQFSLDAVAAALERAGVGAGLLDLFFARMLRDAFALASVDEYRPFRELAGSALTVVAPSLDPDDIDTVLGAFGDLGIHPDAAASVVATFGVLRWRRGRSCAVAVESDSNVGSLPVVEREPEPTREVRR